MQLSVVAAVVAVSLSSPQPPKTALPEDAFRAIEDPIANTRAFDVGSTELSGGDELTPFTTNHKFANSFIVDGRDATARLDLNPSPAFPGYEDMLHRPRTADPGIYVYGQDRPGVHSMLTVESTDLAGHGSISFPSRKGPEVFADEAETHLDFADGRATVRFSIRPGGRVNIRGVHLDLPVDVDIESPDPSKVLVGADAVPAKRTGFTVGSRDRHAIAVGDFDEDGRQDMFVSVGGILGQSDQPEYIDYVTNEAQLQNPDGTYTRERDDGLRTLGCRGREAAAPDIDGDGSPEVFEGCENSRPRIYDRDERGWHSHKLPLKGAEYRWANVDRDPAVELLVFSGTKMQTWDFDDGRPEMAGEIELPAPPGGLVALGSYNDDRWVDAFVPSFMGTSLLIGGPGGFRVVAPERLERLGLPTRSGAIAFVDFDNDGDSDLDFAGQGLFENLGRGHDFRDLGRLLTKGRYSMLSWADVDNDGRRDLLAAAGVRPFAPMLDITQEMNEVDGGHWLELEIPDALGARVTVQAGGRTYTGFSGAAEGSRWSDAHRRVYFGLGDANEAKVTVHWPEGGSKTFATPADRLIDVER